MHVLFSDQVWAVAVFGMGEPAFFHDTWGGGGRTQALGKKNKGGLRGGLTRRVIQCRTATGYGVCLNCFLKTLITK